MTQRHNVGGIHITSSNNTSTIRDINITWTRVLDGDSDEDILYRDLFNRIGSLISNDDISHLYAITDALWEPGKTIVSKTMLKAYLAQRDPEDEGWIVDTIIGDPNRNLLADDGEPDDYSWSFTDDELYLAEHDWMPGDEIEQGDVMYSYTEEDV